MMLTLDEELVSIAGEELGALCRDGGNGIDASHVCNGGERQRRADSYHCGVDVVSEADCCAACYKVRNTNRQVQSTQIKKRRRERRRRRSTRKTRATNGSSAGMKARSSASKTEKSRFPSNKSWTRAKVRTESKTRQPQHGRDRSKEAAHSKKANHFAPSSKTHECGSSVRHFPIGAIQTCIAPAILDKESATRACWAVRCPSNLCHACYWLRRISAPVKTCFVCRLSVGKQRRLVSCLKPRQGWLNKGGAGFELAGASVGRMLYPAWFGVCFAKENFEARRGDMWDSGIGSAA